MVNIFFAEFEGERIPHLDKMRAYKKANQEEKDKGDEDNYVLQRLFKKTGIVFINPLPDDKF